MRLLVALAAVAALLGLAAPLAADSDFEDFTVSATVEGRCTIDQTSTLAFGAYHGADLVGETVIDVTCVDGTPGPRLALDNGLYLAPGTAPQPRRMMSASGFFLAYDLYANSGRTTCWGAAAVCSPARTSSVTADGEVHSLTVYGRVRASQPLHFGSYSDTVRATVTF